MSASPPLVVGVTGASGAELGRRLMLRLAEARIPLVVTATEAGRRVWTEELGTPLKATLAELGEAVRYADIRDIGDAIASGSVPTRGMVVVPASMNLVAAVAAGRAENLLERAADVTLKEGRQLTLVPRETPLSAIHLRNLLTLARLGVRIVPPMPAFYLRPQSLDDLYAALTERIIQTLALPDLPPAEDWQYRSDA
ncbi:MAG TPA: UbiX family flavin prenyltransferase [Dehalococcoidia bacterium]|nr:UbiX family flavin prenyltransferase [Dehalococcoidia bacterium]